MNAPLVTVVIPTANRPGLVLRALASVLEQTHAALDVVVVADGPNPATLAALAAITDPRVRVLETGRPCGAGAARNFAANTARGEWIAFLDDDDEWLPDKIERQLAAAAGRCVLVSCRSRVHTDSGTEIWPRTLYHGQMPVDDYLFDRRTVFRGDAHLGTSSFLLPTHLFARTRFSTDRQNEDTTLLLRVTKEAGAAIVMAPETLVVLYKEENRDSLGSRFAWREMLAWADANRSLLTKRAYSGFCLIYLGSQAARRADYPAFVILLGHALARGAPTLRQFLTYLAFWLLPFRLRQRLRTRFAGRPRVQPAVLIRHSALYIAAKLLPGVIGMASTALLTRMLSPTSYGVYGLALLVMTFGSAIAFDWLGLAYLRLGGAQADQSRAVTTTALVFAVLVGATAAIGAAAWAMGGFASRDAGAVAAGLVLMWCYAAFELAARFHVARSRPLRYLVMNLGRAVIAAACAICAAWLTRSPVAAALGLAAGTVGGVALGGLPCPPGKVDWRLARALLAFGLPLAASLALAGVATSGARSLLEVLGSTAQLGLYTAAFLLVQNTLAVVAAGIASAGYSLAVRAVERADGAAASRQLRANGTLLMVVLSPMATGMALTAPGLAALLVGEPYVAVVAALTPWLAAAGFFAGMRGHFLDHAFQLGKRPDLQLGVTGLAAVVAVGLTVALVPRWGALGAAVAQAVAMAASCVHAAAIGRRAWPMPLLAAALLRTGMACAVMAIAVRAVPGGLAGQVVAGAVSYAAAMLLLQARWLAGLRPRAYSSNIGTRESTSSSAIVTLNARTRAG